MRRPVPHRSNHIPITRAVGYRIDLHAKGRSLTGEGEQLVEKLLSRHPGVTEYDTGRGWIVWWNIPPGAPARDLKRAVQRICDEHSEHRADA